MMDFVVDRIAEETDGARQALDPEFLRFSPAAVRSHRSARGRA